METTTCISPRRIHIATGKQIQNHDTDLYGRHKNGGNIPVAISLSPLESVARGLIAVAIRDISERKKMEIMLRLAEGERQFQQALDMIMEGAQIIGPDWRYVYVNNAAAEHGKHKREELIGKTMMEMYPGIENTRLYDTLRLCLESNRGEQFVNEFVYPDQSKAYFELRIQPVPQGLFILSIDVTGRIKNEHELTDRNRELKDSNDALEQFAYIASHDLQEPLRTVSNYIGLLDRTYAQQLNERGKLYITHISNATHRMQLLIKGLLEFARIGKQSEREFVDINHLIHQVLEDLSLLVSEQNARLVIDTMPDRMYVCSEDIRRLFQNLITNGIKFRQPDVLPKIEIGAVEENNAWKFWVKDNGIGIDPKFHKRIFLMFQRLHTRKTHDGSGIGLAHCKKIVESHSGRLWVESAPNAGSTFYFTLSKNSIHEFQD